MNALSKHKLVVAVGALALLLAILGCWWFFGRKPPVKATPPTILSPQDMDTVGLSFTVAGTVGTYPADIQVGADCASPTTTGPYHANPSWSVGFTASNPANPCMATATASGATATVKFVVVRQPVLVINPPGSKSESALATSAHTPAPPDPFKVSGHHTHPTKLAVTLTLFRQNLDDAGPVQMDQQVADDDGDDPSNSGHKLWHKDFPRKHDGYYFFVAAASPDGKPIKTSQMRKVNKP